MLLKASLRPFCSARKSSFFVAFFGNNVYVFPQAEMSLVWVYEGRNVLFSHMFFESEECCPRIQ